MKPHSMCRCEPDGKTTISYSPPAPTPKEDNKRPWHKHILPNRRGKR